MRRWSRVLIVSAVLAVGGCSFTPRLEAEVESFSRLDRSPAPAALAIVPFTGLDGASLEFRRYAERLAAALQARGFTVVPAAAEPAFRMRLGYRVGDGREVVRTVPAPSYRRRGRVVGYRDPFFYPFGGYEVVSWTVFGRHVVLVLVDAASGAEVWRASAFSLGTRASLRDDFDAMVEAALADFPAEVSRRVVVPLAPES